MAQAVYDTAPRDKGKKPPQLINANPWRRGIRAVVQPTRRGPSPEMMAAIEEYNRTRNNGRQH